MIRIGTKEVQGFETRHNEALRALAPECMLFLRRTEEFPLRTAGRIALYGSGARQTVKGGTGSGDVNVRHFVTIEEGLERAGFEITTKNWLDAYDEVRRQAKPAFIEKIRQEAAALGRDPVTFGMGAVMPEPEYELPLEGEGETAVYVVGRICGEGSDRRDIPGDLRLTESEKRDIRKLAEEKEHLLLVLNVGGPIDLTEIPEIRNILLLSQLGTVTGDAFADVLLGKANPSGKLTTTWAPADAYQKIGTFGEEEETEYREGIFVGYRYFDAAGRTPLFPFGFGLGYTDFSIESRDTAIVDGVLEVQAEVCNTGNAAGKETVQLYYSAPEGRLSHPCQELGVFVKTKMLQPGEAEIVTLRLPLENMVSYDEEQEAWILEKGSWTIRIGNSSRDLKACCRIGLDSEAVIEKVRKVFGNSGFEDWTPAVSSYIYANEKTEVPVLKADAKALHGIGLFERNRLQEEAEQETLPETDAFSEQELAEICCGRFSDNSKKQLGDSGSMVPGTASESAEAIRLHGYGKLTLADGPAGLRLAECYALDENGSPVKFGIGSDSMVEDFFTEEDRERVYGAARKKEEQYRDAQHFYQYAAAIPIGTAIAQSWNPELAEYCGSIVAEEMEIFGVNVWLAPAMNIHRSVLCGRNFEYYSEDPVISGVIAGAVTRGVQKHSKCAVTIKHFAGNNQERNRMYNNSHVSERAFREIYLKGFEICVKETQPVFVMTSYNLINGTHAAEHKGLLEKVLRQEWGFRGVVMTDWTTTTNPGADLPGQKYGNSHPSRCIIAGNDLIMPGSPQDRDGILGALHGEDPEVTLTKEELNACVRRILAVSKKLS
ncbi:MAG: glycoside hydrolase family 3 N-terminal domain-containing protein [Lachnospiraceae bacterium]|nr:glycoside hydrolase family 3 N-terminal domain-containing protein [Lachnospiraceae bacterium]